jgi:carbon-monoxide dehydrogenase small subunit
MEKQTIRLRINAEEYELHISANETLLEVLRERLSLTGAKEGCQDGSCGACTVLLDGKPVRSCLILAVEAEGHDIVTIEGLAPSEELHPIQEAFINHGGVQCGFCTPGLILTAKALIDNNPEPTETEVKEAISGNLCRCTGYTKIVKSIIAATKRR